MHANNPSSLTRLLKVVAEEERERAYKHPDFILSPSICVNSKSATSYSSSPSKFLWSPPSPPGRSGVAAVSSCHQHSEDWLSWVQISCRARSSFSAWAVYRAGWRTFVDDWAVNTNFYPTFGCQTYHFIYVCHSVIRFLTLCVCVFCYCWLSVSL